MEKEEFKKGVKESCRSRKNSSRGSSRSRKEQ